MEGLKIGKLKSSRIKRSVSLERARVEDLNREGEKRKKKSKKGKRQELGCSGPDTVVCSTRMSVSANKPHLGNLLYSKLFAEWMNGWMNGWRGVSSFDFLERG